MMGWRARLDVERDDPSRGRGWAVLAVVLVSLWVIAVAITVVYLARLLPD